MPTSPSSKRASTSLAKAVQEGDIAIQLMFSTGSQKSFLRCSMVRRGHWAYLLLMTSLELCTDIVHNHLFVSPAQARAHGSCQLPSEEVMKQRRGPFLPWLLATKCNGNSFLIRRDPSCVAAWQMQSLW